MAKNANKKAGVWQSLRNAWKVPDIRKKILYTFCMLLVFRLVGVIPAPGIDYAAVQASTSSLPILDLVNMMTGSNFANMTIMAMGITPYINSSIIMQLLTIAIPALERMQKSGPEGQKKIAQITRYVTIVLAVIQAIGLVSSLGYIKNGWFNYLLVGVTMAGGTALAMWIGERITEKGIGNGISLLIFAGIISNLFTGVTTMLKSAHAILTVYPWLDADLLFAGVIAHDLSKIREMKSDEAGNVNDYTTVGLLLGHLVHGVTQVAEAARRAGIESDNEYVLLLEHMVISHHGEAEFGSPRPPMFPEAEMLHWLDVLDARMNEMGGILQRTPMGAFSERIWSLDRRVYHPRYLSETPAEIEEKPERRSRPDADTAYQGLL